MVPLHCWLSFFLLYLSVHNYIYNIMYIFFINRIQINYNNLEPEVVELVSECLVTEFQVLLSLFHQLQDKVCIYEAIWYVHFTSF